MNSIELKNHLDSLGFPVAYSHFESKKTPPFICYLETNSDNVMADDAVYKEIDNIDIELYTVKKDKALEKRVADLLNSLNMPFEKSSVFINSEKIYKITYEVTLL